MRTKHKVITIDGLSRTEIEKPKSLSWSGIGQGNAVAGPLCLSILSPMITAYKKLTQVTSISSPTKNTRYKSHIISYIDDNNATTNYTKEIKIEKIIKDASHNLNTWDKLLQASGGKLAIQKIGIVSKKNCGGISRPEGTE